jgi:hypothetical protein
MICKPNPPIAPPLRGKHPENSIVIAAPADEGCTILDSCDQCGRRLFRPHVADGRAFCGDCCPKCAEIAMFGVPTSMMRGLRR